MLVIGLTTEVVINPTSQTPIPGVNINNSNPTPITELDSSGAPIYGDVTPGSLDILFRGGLKCSKQTPLQM